MLGMYMPGATEMIVIGILGVLIFGSRLPKIARGLGSSVVEFKKGLKGVADEVGDIQGELNSAKSEVNEQIADTKQQAKNILK